MHSSSNAHLHHCHVPERTVGKCQCDYQGRGATAPYRTDGGGETDFIFIRFIGSTRIIISINNSGAHTGVYVTSSAVG
jgi:hypothetical protein